MKRKLVQSELILLSQQSTSLIQVARFVTFFSLLRKSRRLYKFNKIQTQI